MENVGMGQLKMTTEDHLLTITPWPAVIVVAAYLYFVLHAGPRMMKTRPAFQLQPIIITYNLFLVAGSTWFVIRYHFVSDGQFHNGHCKPSELDSKTYQSMNDMVYLYFLSKIIELMDTVFFILRKKMNQVSFLHVYHHANMVLTTWFFIKVVPGSQLAIITYSNTFVHILMYGYYLLAALGPSVQKYLWWKKYLTRIQMIQFLIIMGYMASLVMNPSCQVQKKFIILTIVNTLSFLVLFYFFYSQAYGKKKQDLKLY